MNLRLNARKKTKGELDNMLGTVVFILVIAIILFSFINYNNAISKKQKINLIARQYLLRMETVGYLSSDDMEAMAQELSEMGFYGNPEKGNTEPVGNGNFSGTTINRVGYGNEIIVAFTVYTDDWVLADGNIFSPKYELERYPITIEYKSTSKE